MSTPVFDFVNRQQIYVERVKNWYAQDFKRYQKLIADAVNDFLRKLGIKSLGDLSQSKFRALLKRIDTRVSKILEGYSEEWQGELKRFAFADTRVQKTVFGKLVPKKDFSGPTGAGVWAKIKDGIIPASGNKIVEQLKDFGNVARDKIRRRVNTGFANNEEVSELAEQVASTSARTFTSTVQTIGNMARSNIATMLQYVTATVTDTLGLIAFDCYQWVSVMDSKTTDLCRGLNGRTFRHGEGPLPPAHNYCRSRTYPVDCGDELPKVPTFFSWLLTQTKDFIGDAFGDSFAKKFADGSIKQGDIPDWQSLPTLDVEAFEGKTKFLTA